jgi:environmental stress-induced protein Ves
VSVRIVAAGTARRMPWKNGRGTTLELATDAPASDPEAWMWRLSIADVPERGPFSRWPGIDRWIACLVGNGLRLHRGRRIDEAPREGEALAFAGEDEVTGEPLADGVRDINLMLRRDGRRGRLRVVREQGGRADGAVVILHAFAATAAVSVGIGPDTVRLEPGATLVATGSLAWSGRPGDTLAVAEIG